MIKLALLVVAWCVTKSIAEDTVAAAASALRLAITFSYNDNNKIVDLINVVQDLLL
jgi:hypothetical protein